MEKQQLKTLTGVVKKLYAVGERKEASILNSFIKKVAQDLFDDSSLEEEYYPTSPAHGIFADKEPSSSEELASRGDFAAMTLGDAYERYSGLVFPEHVTLEDKFSQRGQMYDFNPDGLLVDQWDDLMAVRNENKTVAYFLRKLHRAWEELGESQIDEVPVGEELGLARTNLSKKQESGDQNVLRIQEIVGANSTGDWDHQTRVATKRFLEERDSLLFHPDIPADKYVFSIMMSGPRGFEVRNSDTGMINGNRLSDWRMLVEALDEGYRYQTSSLEDLRESPAMDKLSSDFSSYKGLVRR
jgi:hypothetical protein